MTGTEGAGRTISLAAPVEHWPAAELSIGLAADGIVGRGVLLDVPRSRGVPWLEPGDRVMTRVG
jgi:hypothetical protein